MGDNTTFETTADLTFMNPVTLNGTVNLGGSTVRLLGQITLAQNSAINIPSPFLSAYVGPMTGTGGLTKNGPGTLYLTGSGGNLYSGETVINAGLVVASGINATPANSNVTINSGAVLSLDVTPLGDRYQTVETMGGLSGNGTLAATTRNWYYNGFVPFKIIVGANNGDGQLRRSAHVVSEYCRRRC